MRRLALLFGAFLAIGSMVYGSSLSSDFVIWDDDSLITENPIVAELSAASVRAAFTSYDPELYIPLTLLTFQIENALFGLNPVAYHVDNLLLHVLNALLVLLLLERLGLRRIPALIAALLFLVHPINTEAVVWASARKDLLCAAFLLGSLVAFLRWRDEGRARHYMLAVLFALLAMLSKALAIMLPAALLLCDLLRGHRWFSRDIGRYAPFVLLAVLFFIIGIFGKTENIGALTPLQTALLAAKATAGYPALFAWPASLSILYPQITPVTMQSAEFVVPLLVCMAAAAIALFAWRRWRWVSVGIAWYALFLLPSFSNFAKAGDLYVMSDRYPYIAQIGLLLMLGIAAQRRIPASWSRFLIGISVVVLLALGIAAHRRSAVWVDSETLFRDALAKNDGSVIMHYNLGIVAYYRGNIEEAQHEYGRAVALDPAYSDAYRGLGRIAKDRGDIPGAIAILRTAVENDPDDPEIRNDLGGLLIDQGNIDEAIVHLERAVLLLPVYADAHANLGAAYGKAERYEEAVAALKEAQRLRALNAGGL